MFGRSIWGEGSGLRCPFNHLPGKLRIFNRHGRDGEIAFSPDNPNLKDTKALLRDGVLNTWIPLAEAIKPQHNTTQVASGSQRRRQPAHV